MGMVGPNESEAPVAIADIAQTTIKHATAIVDPLRFLAPEKTLLVDKGNVGHSECRRRIKLVDVSKPGASQ